MDKEQNLYLHNSTPHFKLYKFEQTNQVRPKFSRYVNGTRFHQHTPRPLHFNSQLHPRSLTSPFLSLPLRNTTPLHKLPTLKKNTLPTPPLPTPLSTLLIIQIKKKHLNTSLVSPLATLPNVAIPKLQQLVNASLPRSLFNTPCDAEHRIEQHNPSPLINQPPRLPINTPLDFPNRSKSVTKSIVTRLPNFFFSPYFSPRLPPPLFHLSLATPKLRFTSPTRPKAQHHHHLTHALDPFAPPNHFYNPFLTRPWTPKNSLFLTPRKITKIALF